MNWLKDIERTIDFTYDLEANQILPFLDILPIRITKN